MPVSRPDSKPIILPAKNVLTERPFHPRPVLRQDYVAPHTELEMALAEIWQEFLRIEKIGVHDDFFELGGHSLLALQMIPRVRAKFHVDLVPRDVLAAPTIAGMALVVEDKIIVQLENVDAAAPVKVPQES
jgi:hypothetical protein